MLFDSGNPSLLSYTRELAGDPLGAPSTIWSEQQIKDSINAVYPEVFVYLKGIQTGWALGRAYVSGDGSAYEFSAPTDMAQLLLVESSATANLSTATDPSSSAVKLHQITEAVHALQKFWLDDLGTNERLAYHLGESVGVVPVVASGTSNIRITYLKEPAALSGDTDDPTLPASFHPLLCLRAAILLRISRDFVVEDLWAEVQRREAELGIISDKGASVRA